MRGAAVKQVRVAIDPVSETLTKILVLGPTGYEASPAAMAQMAMLCNVSHKGGAGWLEFDRDKARTKMAVQEAALYLDRQVCWLSKLEFEELKKG